MVSSTKDASNINGSYAISLSDLQKISVENTTSLPKKIKEYGDKTSSKEYDKFYKDFYKKIRNEQLLTHSDFINYGKNQLSTIKNSEEKESAAFIIALGCYTMEYLLDNKDNVETLHYFGNSIKQRFYNDKNGLFDIQPNIIHLTSSVAHAFRIVGVVVVVTAATVLTYGVGAMWATAAVSAGGLGLAAGSAATVGISAVSAAGAGVGAYYGLCSPIMKEPCPET